MHHRRRTTGQEASAKTANGYHRATTETKDRQLRGRLAGADEARRKLRWCRDKEMFAESIQTGQALTAPATTHDAQSQIVSSTLVARQGLEP